MAEPLVLLPGMMCDARLFGPQIAELSANIAVTVAPITGGERIEEIASGLLDLLPRRFALAGAGLGGNVAMELLRRAPERVSRIALIATSPLAETPQVAGERESQIIAARTGRLVAAVQERLPKSALAPGAYRDEVVALMLDMAETLGADVFVRQSRALQRQRDQQKTLRTCKVPALVLCGVHDTICPVQRHSFMAELIPSAELVVLDHSGHLPSLEQPGETTDALLRWMKAPMLLR
ncbi:alpha/beta fold hydrolase [Sulfitobacter sp. D35]|uniref:alpha/beta fold hydrolase n=1 Tax=Sulfitobacter sp. D35 TaxID=3083252 RepID=UPI00296E9911|nr:alpha/beta fold hydrolase [Sulfitobacter sp. D35]MDW4499642.1 alpha/beta fold hydrolase [Sulfitobacter sp. D35]